MSTNFQQIQKNFIDCFSPYHPQPTRRTHNNIEDPPKAESIINYQLNTLSIPHSQTPRTALVSSFIRALFAPYAQPIFAFVAIFVKLVLTLPRLTSTAPLFFHPVNNPMALLICKIFFVNPAIFEFLVPVITVALFAA